MSDITTKYKSKFTGKEIDAGIENARNAVPLDGSKAITGNLTIEKSFPQLFLRHTGNQRQLDMNMGGDGYAAIYNRQDNNNLVALYLNAETGNANTCFRLSRKAGGVSTTYDILHTGNKPSGSYTGNGSATARTIDTGGIGKAVLIWSPTSTTIAVVTNNAGALCKTETTVKALKNSACAFDAGTLTLATNDETLNANGVTYTYQVL